MHRAEFRKQGNNRLIFFSKYTIYIVMGLCVVIREDKYAYSEKCDEGGT